MDGTLIMEMGSDVIGMDKTSDRREFDLSDVALKWSQGQSVYQFQNEHTIAWILHWIYIIPRITPRIRRGSVKRRRKRLKSQILTQQVANPPGKQAN